MNVHLRSSQHFICAFVIRNCHCNSFASPQCLSFIYIYNFSSHPVAIPIPPDCTAAVCNEPTSDGIGVIINPHKTSKLNLMPTSVAAGK